MRIIRIKAKVKKAKKERKYPYENLNELLDEYMTYGGLIEYVDYEGMGYLSKSSARSSYGKAIKRLGLPIELHYGENNSLYLEKKSMYS